MTMLEAMKLPDLKQYIDGLATGEAVMVEEKHIAESQATGRHLLSSGRVWYLLVIGSPVCYGSGWGTAGLSEVVNVFQECGFIATHRTFSEFQPVAVSVALVFVCL